MPVFALTVISLMLAGSLFGNQAAGPSPEPAAGRLETARTAPAALPVSLRTELSASMFHGTVVTIDRVALHVTIRTDFGRTVAVPVETCDMIQGVRAGDRVRLDVDAQGVVRLQEKTGGYRTTAPDVFAPAVSLPGHCPETST
jgi:hypothetical protein